MMCLMIISFAAFLSNSKVLAQTERSIVFNVTNIPTIVGRILISADKGGYYGTTDVKTSQMNIELKRAIVNWYCNVFIYIYFYC